MANRSQIFLLALLVPAGAGAPWISAQATAGAADGQIVLKANARTVVVDVVVTGKNGLPVAGLRKEDFQAEEDGRPQTITTFEEHASVQSVPASLPSLPPGVFTNVPRFTPTESVTVLLLDSLNTPLADQATVHAQMLKYLKDPQPGRRCAIFALGRQLRYVQGFTDDPAILASALRSQTRGAEPQSSAMLRSYTEANAAAQAIAHLSDAGMGAAPIAGEGERQAFQQDQRVLMTLDAFQQLAKYLAAIPGRKNVVWFSSAFPVVVFANPGKGESFDIQRNYGDQLKESDRLLAAAQVAIYPIAAEGLAGDSLYDTQHDLLAPGGGFAARQQSGQSLQADADQRIADHTTMDEIAKDTGGQAIYNTNGLDDALARAADHGAHYYTLYYTPANTAADGQFRKIQVKLASGGYKLAYRRGYYAADAKTASPQEATQTGDPLLSSMKPGLPASTQIPVALRVRVKAGPAPAGDHAGGNGNLKGAPTRYAVDFVIAARGLQLEATPDGGRKGRIEASLVAYDQDGKPLNWLTRQIDLTMDAARFAQVQANGVNFQFEIDVPKKGVTLRSGVFDWGSKKAGTLEVALDSVVDVARD